MQKLYSTSRTAGQAADVRYGLGVVSNEEPDAVMHMPTIRGRGLLVKWINNVSISTIGFRRNHANYSAK